MIPIPWVEVEKAAVYFRGWHWEVVGIKGHSMGPCWLFVTHGEEDAVREKRL